MELTSVLSARAIAWVESADLNPKGRVFFPDLVRAAVARYEFQSFPQKLEDFDESKGVTFKAGKIDGVVVESLSIYTYGITLETRVSTSESKRLLEEALGWAARELGLTYAPGMIRRWQYASQITFRSDMPLASFDAAIARLSWSVSKGVSESLGEDLAYGVAGLFLDHDQLARKHPIGRFSIQRRDNTPLAENKYYSDAPLPTDLHIEVVKQFESDLRGTK